jgi:tRNA/rRNA methyltransferase
MSWDSSNMVVVLHQIRSPDNLGAVARLMANFGLSRLVVSDPVTHAFSAAQKLAVGGESVLSGMYVAKDLEEAVGRVTSGLEASDAALARGGANALGAARPIRASGARFWGRETGPVG